MPRKGIVMDEQSINTRVDNLEQNRTQNQIHIGTVIWLMPKISTVVQQGKEGLFNKWD